MTAAFVMKNLFNYDPVLPVPQNCPTELVTVYLTDKVEAAIQAKQLGWQRTVVVESAVEDTPQARLDVVTKINCYPELFLNDTNLEHVFVCDGNVVRLDSNYPEFVRNAMASGKALYVTSGWYSGHANNMLEELHRSGKQERWNQWKQSTIERTQKYVENLREFGIVNLETAVPVVSAKYIGWNLNLKKEEPRLDDLLQAEYFFHNQGNIILSYLAARYPDASYHYKGFKNNGQISMHKKVLI